MKYLVKLGLICLLFSNPVMGLDKPNILLICIDDLRPELKCYGVEYIHSPNIDSIAANGRLFQRHYVNAPTCGASRYTLLTGRYHIGNNGAIFDRAKKLKSKPDSVPASLPAWFKQNGYNTVAIGKVSHHPGGLGGEDWNDPDTVEMPLSWTRSLLPAGQWQHPRGWMHGLANGEIRNNAKEMAVIQALEGPDEIYPDGPVANVALEQLDQLAKDDKPFFLAYGILRPHHLPFGAPKKYLDIYAETELPAIQNHGKPKGKTTWHNSGEFRKYLSWGKDPDKDPEFAIDVRKHYAACVSYADAQVGKILAQLEASGKADNTIVVLWGDHGWHLGEHQVWGKHTLFEESLHSPLLISYPGIDSPGTTNPSIVETVDLFPTLAELAKLPKPDFVDGRSLVPILENADLQDHRNAIAYHKNYRTIRTDTHRLILHKDHAELYNHTTDKGETENISAENQALVQELSSVIKNRLDGR